MITNKKQTKGAIKAAVDQANKCMTIEKAIEITGGLELWGETENFSGPPSFVKEMIKEASESNGD